MARLPRQGLAECNKNSPPQDRRYSVAPYGEADALTRKAIELAKQGDTTALRLCIERILPTRKDRPVSFDMPRIETTADSVKAAAAIASAVADGELTPMEARELSRVVDGYTRAVETADLAARLDRLEQHTQKK